jgi:hypothetical protein
MTTSMALLAQRTLASITHVNGATKFDVAQDKRARHSGKRDQHQNQNASM